MTRFGILLGGLLLAGCNVTLPGMEASAPPSTIVQAEPLQAEASQGEPPPPPSVPVAELDCVAGRSGRTITCE